jgi:DNA-binding PadR family transcriptional regulator
MHRHHHLREYLERFVREGPDFEGFPWGETEHHCAGRDPRNRGGRGFRHFGFGGGGPGGFGFRAGRKLSAADLQLLILALIGERPRHGYDLIKAIEERSRGFYSPSPGVIYPALTYLEEAGDAAPEVEGTRKLYRLTDAGRARLEEARAQADALLRRLEELGRGMDRVREAFSADEDAGDDPLRRGRHGDPNLREAFRLLRHALAAARGAPPDELARIAEIVRRAAAEIRGGDDRDA